MPAALHRKEKSMVFYPCPVIGLCLGQPWIIRYPGKLTWLHACDKLHAFEQVMPSVDANAAMSQTEKKPASFGLMHPASPVSF